MVGKDLDRFPLLKIQLITGWQPIADYLEQQKGRYARHNGGRPAYSLLSMFKAVLIGQWHSLSEPELEHSLITRIGFYLFCGFDEPDTPGHSTLCRYRNWPVQNNLLAELLNLINRQLTDKGLKIQHAKAAVIDAAIIQTAGGKQRRAIETDENGTVSENTPSKDQDARWIKKDGRFKLGYKQHTRTDHEGYIEKLHIRPANEHECNHFEPLLQDIDEGTKVYAGKEYDSKANRALLQHKGLSDGIMRKAPGSSVNRGR